MQKRIFFVLAFFAIAVIGCTSFEEQVEREMKSWVGHHTSELIRAYGLPTEVIDKQDVGKIIIYVYEGEYTTPGYATSTTETSGFVKNPTRTTSTYYVPPRTYHYQLIKVFFTNKDGIITNYYWEGP